MSDLEARVKNLFDMCMQAKTKGHDIFFNYYPHVQAVELRCFANGWIRNIKETPTETFYFYIGKNNDLALTQDNIHKIEIAEAYLKGLIECTSPTT